MMEGAAVYWLIIGFGNPATTTAYIAGKFPTAASCLAVLEKTEIVIPKGNNENEWAGLKTCLPDIDIRASYPMLATGAFK